MKVPSGFTPEPGAQRCGDSWQDFLMVTGELPGTQGYGKDSKHSLPPVVSEGAPTKTVPGATPGTWYSYDTDAERKFVDGMAPSAKRVYTELDAVNEGRLGNNSKLRLTPMQIQEVQYLMDLHEANLDRVEALYAYWEGDRNLHPQTGEYTTNEWPLPAGDDIEDYVAECEGLSGKWVEETGFGFEGGTVLRSYYCPGGAGLARRAKDRNAIGRLLIDAAKAIRCAHWGLWRMALYGMERAAWDAGPGGRGIQQRPGEYTAPLGLQQRPGEYVPPIGFSNVPPEDLPPIPDPIEPDPEEAAETEGPRDIPRRSPLAGGATGLLPPGPPPPAASPWRTPLLVGGAAAVAWVLLK